MKERRDASQVRGPALRKILQRLIGDSVQPARKRVRMELPVPNLGIVFREPGTQFLKLPRRQGFDLAFEFFHSAHKHLTTILP